MEFRRCVTPEPTTVNGQAAYIINHGKGAKLTGLASGNSSKIIQGTFSVEAIRNYVTCFEPSEINTANRFFRPLRATQDPLRPFVVKTAQPVGKNTVPPVVAKLSIAA